MKLNLKIIGLLTPALIVAGYLSIPITMSATTSDSPEITKLLANAKAEAVELKADSAGMQSFATSKASWQTYATQVELIRQHVNATGKLLTKLENAEASGSEWQQTAIKRIRPLLKELAENTETTIKHLKNNQSKVHFSEFQDYVKANFELAADLEALIHDFINYGEAQEKVDHLGHKLEVKG